MSFVNGPYVYVNLKGLRTPLDRGSACRAPHLLRAPHGGDGGRGGHGGGLDGPLEGPLVMLRKTESLSPSKNELYAKSNLSSLVAFSGTPTGLS